MEKEKTILFNIKKINNKVFQIMAKDASEKNIPRMSSTQLVIVDYLLAHNKKAYQKDIEKDLNMTRATISGVLKTMEKNQIINSKPSIEDSRTNEISLTEISKERHLESKKKMNEIENVIRKDITEEELEIFMQVIYKIENNMEIYKEDKC